MKRITINRRRLLKLGWPFMVLFLLAVAVLAERAGLKMDRTEDNNRQAFENRLFEVSDDEFSPAVLTQIECLVIANSEDDQSNEMLEEMEQVLRDMRIGYRLCDLSSEELPDLSSYEKIIVTLSDLGALDKKIIDLCDWVANGGHMMNTGTFTYNEYFTICGNKFGIENVVNTKYVLANGLEITDGFMINQKDTKIVYEDPVAGCLEMALISDCVVYLREYETGIPLLWEVDYGEGKFVISNQVVTGKESRGILCASYSLLGDICAYPVINASVYYLDDFPSPVPLGESKYISRDYGISISNFYTNIWWPDIMRLEDKYGIIHTGLIMEDYSDIVEPPFVRNEYTERFVFFGNMLLNQGGELGIHGYNHMPLCLDNYDYLGLFDGYNKWPSSEYMEESIAEVIDFAYDLFPKSRLTVYVPPSNILSEEGREALKKSWPEMKIIASNYFAGEAAYIQEFCVAEDGIVETPRITSDCEITDFMKFAAFSELNYHFVQSHFFHPDDVLDVDRGADLGWKEMYTRLDEYVKYICDAAPMMRNVSGTGMGEAVREFDKLSVERIQKDDTLELNLGGFYKEAYLLVRINEGTYISVTNGEMEHITGNIYLLHATDDQVQIRYR